MIKLGSFISCDRGVGVRGFDSEVILLDGIIVNLEQVRVLDFKEKIRLSAGKKKRLRKLFLVYKNYAEYWPSWDRKDLALSDEAIRLVWTKKVEKIVTKKSSSFEEEVQTHSIATALFNAIKTRDVFGILAIGS